MAQNPVAGVNYDLIIFFLAKIADTSLVLGLI